MATETRNFLDFVGRFTTIDEDHPLTVMTVLAALPLLDRAGPWLAGGSIRRTLQGQEPESDFDFFFRDEEQLTAFVKDITSRGAVLQSESDHHETYAMIIGFERRLIQCIKFKFYESAAEVVDSFDFTICQCAFDGETLTLGEFTLWDLARKRLVIHKITYPVSTMRRMLKYTKQGFYACAGCLQKILADTATSTELQQQLDIEYVD